MTFAGQIDIDDLQNIIKPAYDNFDDMNYDITKAKTFLKDFILNYCKTVNVPNPPENIDDYNLCIYDDDGLVMKIKNKNFNIKYLFDISNGNVYVSEYNSCAYSYYNNISFQILLIESQYVPSLSYKKATLLSPKK